MSADVSDAEELDFSMYEGSGNPFLERLARGSKLPDAPTPWWKDLLSYDDKGNIDFERSVNQVVGVPQDDLTAAIAVLDRNDGQFLYVDFGKTGNKGPTGEFRVWDGRVWRRDANETTVTRWITQFWRAEHDAIERLEAHIDGVKKDRIAELIATGISEVEARKQATAESKHMYEKLKPIKTFHKGLGKNSGTNSVAARMTRRGRVVVTDEDFDAVPTLMVVGNGVLDFGTALDHKDGDKIAFMPHSSTRRVSMMTPVDYLPDAKCPMFDTYLAGVLPDEEVRHYARKVISSLLLGTPGDKVFLNLVGEPHTGKSVLLEVLQGVLGKYGSSTMASTFISNKRAVKSANGPQPALHRLRKSKLVVSSEPEKNDQWDSGLLKAITGSDPVTSRGMYGLDEVQWTPQFLLILASNHFVKMDSITDTAFLDRLKIITFDQVFLKPTSEMPEEDIPEGRRAIPRLGRKIAASEEELSGVLNWLVEGLKLYLAEGVDTPPEGVEKMTAVMAADISQHVRWLRERLDEGVLMQLSEKEATTALPRGSTGSAASVGIPPKNQRVLVLQAWEDYKAWCADQDIPDKYRGKMVEFKKEIARSGGSSSREPTKLGSSGQGFDRLYWAEWESGYTGRDLLDWRSEGAR